MGVLKGSEMSKLPSWWFSTFGEGGDFRLGTGNNYGAKLLRIKIDYPSPAYQVFVPEQAKLTALTCLSSAKPFRFPRTNI